MPIGFLLEVALRTTSWAVTQSYYGISYLIYGSQQDPLVARLNKLEDQLARSVANKQDTEFYWNTRSKYEPNNWIVISASNLIKICQTKSEALSTVTDHLTQNPINKYTIIQVGSETTNHIYI